MSYRAEHYDYTRQAWVGTDGRYLSCAHPAKMNCTCYGRLHYGELAENPPDNGPDYYDFPKSWSN